MVEAVHGSNKHMYTTHGAKRNQGDLMMVNNRPALTYTEKKGDKITVVGYTYLDEMMPMAYTTGIPEIELDF